MTPGLRPGILKCWIQLDKWLDYATKYINSISGFTKMSGNIKKIWIEQCPYRSWNTFLKAVVAARAQLPHFPSWPGGCVLCKRRPTIFLRARLMYKMPKEIVAIVINCHGTNKNILGIKSNKFSTFWGSKTNNKINSHMKRLENCQGLIDLTRYPNVLLISYPKFFRSIKGSEI